MPPRRSADRSGVVIRKATPIEAVSIQAVPFLAGNLAGFAADT